MYQKKIKLLFGLVIFLFLVSPGNSTTLAQGTDALPPLKIVQLGDSYSAGNGARSESGDRNYSGVEGCYRSPTNWGSQFADSLKDTFAVTYINRACSGGIVDNILSERDMKDSAFKNFDGSCPSPDYPDEEFYKDTSTFKCSKFIEPQIDAIDSSVDLVLMTMGGNDLGFATIVEQCFAMGRRSPDGCKDAVDNANDLMPALESNLINKFAAIRAKLGPNARIIYVSYPNLLLNVNYQLSKWGGTPYDAGTEIRALSLKGENAQKAAVMAANNAAGEEYIVYYDGTKTLFAGHEPSPSVTQRNPNRWIYEFEGTQMVEWYHPNALGHENWGRALSVFETFGAASGSFGTNADVDVVFVVDTTGSMSGEITQVQADLSNLVNQLSTTTDSYRVAVVSYRDFPERTGDYSIDYPFRVDQTFTNDLASIQTAINSLNADGGGDLEETVFSGIQAAINLPWRPGVTKIMIVIGDAPALSPEPISNLTASQIVANSIAVDPVQVFGVDVYGLDSNGAMGEITAGTGGSVIPSSYNLTTTISEILDVAANQPFAWVGQAYSGKIGQPILFDASGSYDPSGQLLSLYEWDFDGDGVFDLETTEATVTHVYSAVYDGYVVLRVTGPGGTALASARTVVNTEGFASQGDEVSCELDENGYSIIVDENGQFIRCTADSLPEIDQDGVTFSIQTFNDVSASYWAWQYIERLYSAGITSGCSTNPLSYCPESSVTRAEMAVFLERGTHYPAAFTASNVIPTFTDTAGHWAEDWIEALKNDGITSGCAAGLYCPDSAVTRAQMAVFLLKSKHGSSYAPPDVSPIFGDTAGNWAEDWIEQLAAEGITSGCAAGLYCPESPVTRAQMAVFLVRTFGLP